MYGSTRSAMPCFAAPLDTIFCEYSLTCSRVVGGLSGRARPSSNAASVVPEDRVRQAPRHPVEHLVVREVRGRARQELGERVVVGVDAGLDRHDALAVDHALHRRVLGLEQVGQVLGRQAGEVLREQVLVVRELHERDVHVGLRAVERRGRLRRASRRWRATSRARTSPRPASSPARTRRARSRRGVARRRLRRHSARAAPPSADVAATATATSARASASADGTTATPPVGRPERPDSAAIGPTARSNRRHSQGSSRVTRFGAVTVRHPMRLLYSSIAALACGRRVRDRLLRASACPSSMRGEPVDDRAPHALVLRRRRHRAPGPAVAAFTGPCEQLVVRDLVLGLLRVLLLQRRHASPPTSTRARSRSRPPTPTGSAAAARNFANSYAAACFSGADLFDDVVRGAADEHAARRGLSGPGIGPTPSSTFLYWPAANSCEIVPSAADVSIVIAACAVADREVVVDTRSCRCSARASTSPCRRATRRSRRRSRRRTSPSSPGRSRPLSLSTIVWPALASQCSIGQESVLSAMPNCAAPLCTICLRVGLHLVERGGRLVGIEPGAPEDGLVVVEDRVRVVERHRVQHVADAVVRDDARRSGRSCSHGRPARHDAAGSTACESIIACRLRVLALQEVGQLPGRETGLEARGVVGVARRRRRASRARRAAAR